MTPNAPQSQSGVREAVPDDLSRDVYCVLGVPVDANEMSDILLSIRVAATRKIPFLISTPNLNYLVSCQTDPEFRESLLMSDLCPADGMSIVWLARLLGIPIKHRVAGSDIFEALQVKRGSATPLKVFLLGGAEGVSAAACQALNAQQAGLHCVGSFYPGFGSIDEMSGDEVIDSVNSSGADFLVVALGAKKGQSWLLRNQSRLLVPVRAHFGAAVNFQARTVKRAPLLAQNLALEWLWRIKEEPYLWRRYWADGCVLLRLLFTRVLVLAIWNWRLQHGRTRQDLTIAQYQDGEAVVLRLVGDATMPNVERAVAAFREALVPQKPVIIDLSKTCEIDARFLGLLLMLNKELKSLGASPMLIGLSPRLERRFRIHGLGYLLSERRNLPFTVHVRGAVGS